MIIVLVMKLIGLVLLLLIIYFHSFCHFLPTFILFFARLLLLFFIVFINFVLFSANRFYSNFIQFQTNIKKIRKKRNLHREFLFCFSNVKNKYVCGEVSRENQIKLPTDPSFVEAFYR